MTRALLVLGVLLTACAGSPSATPSAALAQSDGRAGVDAFNRAMTDAMRRTDREGTMALWEDDGVSLPPEGPPLVGKKAIDAMVRDVEAQNPGLRMKSFDMQCTGIEISGDVAHEYCDEHQIVDLGAGKPPFDGHGRILYVLHRAADGVWRLRREVFQIVKE